MPIYEYECQSCEQVTEISQSIKDAPLAACPQCGGQVSKIISQSTFALKGGGWYADGYSSGSAKACGGGCPASSTSSTPPCKNAATCGC